MLSTFLEGMGTFEKFIEHHALGKMVPNQVELTYINQIPVPEGDSLFGLFGTLFPQQADVVLEDLETPEDLRFLLGATSYATKTTRQPAG